MTRRVIAVSYLTRRVVTAALAANAVKPFFGPSGRGGVGSFAFGWLADELAPHLIAGIAADTAVSGVRRKVTPTGLGLAALTVGALGYSIHRSRGVGVEASSALKSAIEDFDQVPTKVAWKSIARPFNFKDPRVEVIRDVAFTEFGARGHLDIHRPAGRALRGAPVLLQVHGGGWTIGRKDQQGLPLMNRMAAKGWICVAINYRLAPRNPFPAQIIDVKSGIAWIKEHIAEYGGDPDYLVITGGSAGGHLTALAATTPNDPVFQPGFEDKDTSVSAAVPFYGVYDWGDETELASVEAMRETFLGPRIMQKRFSDSPDDFRIASPIHHVNADAPDFFVLHGTNDTLVDVDQARRFVQKLRDNSRATVAYAEFPGAQHAFDVFHSIRSASAVEAVDNFLTWHHDRYLNSTR